MIDSGFNVCQAAASFGSSRIQALGFIDGARKQVEDKDKATCFTEMARWFLLSRTPKTALE